ncbi:MAG: helicase HerA-like domain-containing protein [Verrucomicrobiota bacterium]
MSEPILLAKAGALDLHLLPGMANRHGLVAGATGTGKTVTLQLLAESFSRRGVPVFLADLKGDLSGLSQPGGQSPRVRERVKELGLADYTPGGCPVTFWDVFGEQGHPVRTAVSEMGPLLLSRLLQLNETQAGVLNIVFRVADEHGLLLLDLKDLRAMLNYLGQNAAAFTTRYGNISSASIGAIQRALLQLETEGGDHFFGEPALNLEDLLQTDRGQGVINILAADRLLHAPRVYATMLLWMLNELFENLPEVGDLPQPKLVFFVDEAHLLFDDMPSALVDKVELVVRLIRSKGVGVYFVTQNPRDLPDKVLGQLGNRVQHALRAFTPSDQKAVRAAAQTFRVNPDLDTASVLTELGVGEALVSVLDARGQPTVVQRALVCPPASQIGPISPGQRRQLMDSSRVAGVYEETVDRQSAYERLTGAVAASPAQQAAPPVQVEKRGFFERLFGGGDSPSPETVPPVIPAPAPPPSLPRVEPKARGRGRAPATLGEMVTRSVTRSVTTAVAGALGREIARGLLGGLLGGSSRRRR